MLRDSSDSQVYRPRGQLVLNGASQELVRDLLLVTKEQKGLLRIILSLAYLPMETVSGVLDMYTHTPKCTQANKINFRAAYVHLKINEN